MEVAPGTDGDLDGNGTVNFADFLILSANFGQTAAAAAPVGAAVDAALAEAGDDDDDEDSVISDDLLGGL